MCKKGECLVALTDTIERIGFGSERYLVIESEWEKYRKYFRPEYLTVFNYCPICGKEVNNGT